MYTQYEQINFVLFLLCQVPEVDAIAGGSFKHLEPPDIKAKGYVVRSLEAVLWAFHHTSSFKDGCLKVGKHKNGPNVLD